MPQFEEEILNELEETSSLTKRLLEEVKDSEKDFSIVKSELHTLKSSLESLLTILQSNNNTSVATKIAVLEQKISGIDDLESRLDEINERIIILEYAKQHEYYNIKHNNV